MNAVVFLGPTLNLADARRATAVTILPPASQGDIITLLDDAPDVIGIIDGYFERIPSVWHKEILLAMAEGVTVLGASSMGALRAAELAAFGMIGIGKIFELYRDGILAEDDAVAIQHGPAECGYEPLSEALVNIRSSLEHAEKSGVITRQTAQCMMQIAKDLPYWERSYDRVVSKAIALELPEKEIGAFRKMPKIDQKKLDALALLERINLGPRPEKETRLCYTAKLDTLIERDRCLWRDGELRVTIDTLINSLRLTGPDFVELQRRAQLTKARLARRSWPENSSTDDQTKNLAKLRAALGLDTRERFTVWLKKNGLNRATVVSYAESWLALQQDAAPDNSNRDLKLPSLLNDDILFQLRLENQYDSAISKAAVIERTYLETPPGVVSNLGDDALYDFFCQTTGFQRQYDFSRCGRLLGFTDGPSFAHWISKLYLFQWSNRQKNLPRTPK